jgi:hypothetical protein
MKKQIKGAVLGAIICGMSSLAMADTDVKGDEIKGELSGIDGSFYLITDMQGTEHRVHFDDTTEIKGTLAEGKLVEAYVDGGHVTLIKEEE